MLFVLKSSKQDFVFERTVCVFGQFNMIYALFFSNIPGGGQNSPSAFAEADTCNYSSHIYDTADQSTKTGKESCQKIVVNLRSNKKQLASFQLDQE